MLDLGYILQTYLSEKQKSMSVSTDLVEPGSKIDTPGCKQITTSRTNCRFLRYAGTRTKLFKSNLHLKNLLFFDMEKKYAKTLLIF